jgi:hypothetical protein
MRLFTNFQRFHYVTQGFGKDTNSPIYSITIHIKNFFDTIINFIKLLYIAKKSKLLDKNIKILYNTIGYIWTKKLKYVGNNRWHY